MPDVIVSGNVDTMLGAADNAAIRSAIGLGQTDAPTFLALTAGTGTTKFVYTAANGISLNTNDQGTKIAYSAAGFLFYGSGAPGFFLGQDGSGNGLAAMSSIGCIGFASAFVPNFSNTDVKLFRDEAAGILAQRNGVLKQVFRVYNTNLSGAPEWGGFDWQTTSNTLRIGTDKSGTGASHPIDFVTGGVVRLTLATSGSLISTVNFSVGTAQMAASYYYLNGAYLQESGGVFQITNGTVGTYRDLRLRNVIQSPGVGTSVTPASNGDLVFETTSNTSVTVKLKGSDGTVRSFALTLV
jgi:hypothetical protein